MIQYPPLEFWDLFKSTPGALSTAEAIFLYNACLEVLEEGTLVEMGTHKGKSALVALMAWINKQRNCFYLLEPKFNDVNFLTQTQGAILRFKSRHIENTTCVFEPEYSTDFLPKFNNYSYIMWDSGDHSNPLVQQEKQLLEGKVMKGGIIVMHDVFSQFTACTEAFEQLLNSGEYERLFYDWNEIFEYVKLHNLEEGNDSWHQYPELPHPPNFIGALRKK